MEEQSFDLEKVIQRRVNIYICGEITDDIINIAVSHSNIHIYHSNVA